MYIFDILKDSQAWKTGSKIILEYRHEIFDLGTKLRGLLVNNKKAEMEEEMKKEIMKKWITTASHKLLQVIILITFVTLTILFSNMYVTFVTSIALWVIILLNVKRLYLTSKKIREAYMKLDVFVLSYFSLMASIDVIIILLVLISHFIIRHYLNGLNVLVDPWIYLIS